jgi:hypothetical protein
MITLITLITLPLAGMRSSQIGKRPLRLICDRAKFSGVVVE